MPLRHRVGDQKGRRAALAWGRLVFGESFALGHLLAAADNRCYWRVEGGWQSDFPELANQTRTGKLLLLQAPASSHEANARLRQIGLALAANEVRVPAMVDPPSAPFDPPSAPFDPPSAPFDPPSAPFDPPSAPFDPPSAPFDPPSAPFDPPSKSGLASRRAAANPSGLKGNPAPPRSAQPRSAQPRSAQPRGEEYSYLLVEDLGERTLYQKIAELAGAKGSFSEVDKALPASKLQKIDEYYLKALATMVEIGGADISLDTMSERRIKAEMELFAGWFYRRWLGKTMARGLAGLWRRTRDQVAGKLKNTPYINSHFDFHSDNLIPVDGDIGVIDFQDAVRAPLGYDLVSLTRDCYLHWSAGQRRKWLCQYLELAAQSGLVSSELGAGDLEEWCSWCGVQRLLRVCGTFARLHFLAGKSAWLASLPLVLQHLSECCASLGLGEFADFIDSEVRPAVGQRLAALAKPGV